MSWDVTIDLLCSFLLTVLTAVVLLNVCILLVVSVLLSHLITVLCRLAGHHYTMPVIVVVNRL